MKDLGVAGVYALRGGATLIVRWRLASLGAIVVVLALALVMVGRPTSGETASATSSAFAGASTASATSSPRQSVLLTPRPTSAVLATPVVPTTAGPHGTLRDLKVAMPAGWAVTSGATTLRVAEIGGGIFRIAMFVAVLEPGEPLKVTRPVMQGQSVNMTTGFTISGNSLRELAASVTAGLDDGTEPQQATIGGARGFVWYVPQTSYIGPLAALAVAEWKGTFYVFVQHLPLDGAGGDLFRLFLRGAAFG